MNWAGTGKCLKKNGFPGKTGKVGNYVIVLKNSVKYNIGLVWLVWVSLSAMLKILIKNTKLKQSVSVFDKTERRLHESDYTLELYVCKKSANAFCVL